MAARVPKSFVHTRRNDHIAAIDHDKQQQQQQQRRPGRLRRLIVEHGETAIHLAIILAAIREPTASVWYDQWHAIRSPPPDPEKEGRRGFIRSNRRRAARVGALLGGYTPRIVFLAGVMLRSLQMSTRVRDFFDPSIGYSAGAVLASSFSHREWIPCILVGWGFGGAYWSAFRVRPPGVGVDGVRFKVL